MPVHAGFQSMRWDLRCQDTATIDLIFVKEKRRSENKKGKSEKSIEVLRSQHYRSDNAPVHTIPSIKRHHPDNSIGPWGKRGAARSHDAPIVWVRELK